VFTAPDGHAIDPRFVLKAFKHRADRAGLPEIPLHGLRHSFAAAAISAGESFKVVQERLGHASPSITLGTYSHVTAEAEEAAAHRIANRDFPTAHEHRPGDRHDATDDRTDQTDQ
jgi:integrase